MQSKGERTPAEKRKSSSSGSGRERTRSEPVRQSRQKRLRASAPSRPLVLRSRTGDQVTRTDESGTWALITPADPSKVGTTTISGERAARRVRSGEDTETYTKEKWTVGPKTTLISYASEDSSSSEELLPAEEGQDRPPTRQQRQRPRSPSSESSSSSHRSTSYGSQAQLPRGRKGKNLTSSKERLKLQSLISSQGSLPSAHLRKSDKGFNLEGETFQQFSQLHLQQRQPANKVLLPQ